MALTDCKECGRQVSTEADKCPHCGRPAPSETLYDLRTRAVMITLALMLAVFLVYVLWSG